MAKAAAPTQWCRLAGERLDQGCTDPRCLWGDNGRVRLRPTYECMDVVALKWDEGLARVYTIAPWS